MKPVAVGDEFSWKAGGVVNTFRREADDPAPQFECERIRVTHLRSSMIPQGFPSYTFGAEPEWFAQRGLQLADEAQMPLEVA